MAEIVWLRDGDDVIVNGTRITEDDLRKEIDAFVAENPIRVAAPPSALAHRAWLRLIERAVAE